MTAAAGFHNSTVIMIKSNILGNGFPGITVMHLDDVLRVNGSRLIV